MIYWFGKNLAAVAQLVFFRKIYFIDDHLMPKENPIIFAINHPTAFTDSFVFMVYTHHNCHFILRGDFFKTSSIIRWLMNQIRLIPVFRARDGFSALRQNQLLFEQFYELLHQKGSISIMVEGSHNKAKRLRPVQRGIARIAFGLYEKYGDTDLIIAPIGLTYSDVAAFRGTVAIKFAEPILIKDYLDDYQVNKRKTEKALTTEIESRIRPNLVHIEKAEDDSLAETILDIHRNRSNIPALSPFSKDGTQLEKEIQLINRFNELKDDAKVELKEKVVHYQNLLKQNKVSDLGIGKSSYFNIFNTLIVILATPLFLVGLAANVIPLLFTLNIRKKIKKDEFKGSVTMATGMFAYAIYFLALFVVGLIIGKWWSIVGALIIPILGYAAVLYRDLFLRWNAARKVKSLKQTTQVALKSLSEAILKL